MTPDQSFNADRPQAPDGKFNPISQEYRHVEGIRLSHQEGRNGDGERVVADEEKFIDRSRYWAYVIEEHVTSE
jgi:hypothetical protein